MFRLKELRSAKGKTQKEVAKILGISPQSLGYYENEVNKPDPEMLIKLADYYGCTIDYLVGREDDFGIVSIRQENIVLSSSENEILTFYRSLSDRSKKLYIEIGKRFVDLENNL